MGHGRPAVAASGIAFRWPRAIDDRPNARRRHTASSFRFRTGAGARGGVASARRDSLVLPILNCAAAIELRDDGRIVRAAIAVGPVAPVPARMTDAEAFLVDKWPNEDTLTEAGASCSGRGPSAHQRRPRLAGIPPGRSRRARARDTRRGGDLTPFPFPDKEGGNRR